MEKQEQLKKPAFKEAPEVSEELAGSIRIEGSPTRCPYCHEDCSGEDSEGEARVCAGCLARHHGACWDELGRCGSCQGERSMAVGEQPPAPEGTCRACGTHKSAAITCVGCEKDICRVCYRQRFRRCVDCSAEWIKADKRLAKLRTREHNWQAAAFFSGLLAVAGFVCALAFLFSLSGSDRLIGLGIALPLGALFSWLFRSSLLLRRQLVEEIDALEEELAPFEQGLASRIFEGARRMIASTTRSLRG